MDKTIHGITEERDELADILEDVQTRLDELRSEFNDALDDLQDMITER